MRAQTNPNNPTQVEANDSGVPVKPVPKTLSMTEASQSPFAVNSLIKVGRTGINTPKERTSSSTETRINQMAALRGVFKVTAVPLRVRTFQSSIECEPDSRARGYHEPSQTTTEPRRVRFFFISTMAAKSSTLLCDVRLWIASHSIVLEIVLELVPESWL